MVNLTTFLTAYSSIIINTHCNKVNNGCETLTIYRLIMMTSGQLVKNYVNNIGMNVDVN